MTPLAQTIVRKQLLTPRKDRPKFDDEAGVLTRMDDLHCFDLFEIREMIQDLQAHIHEHGTVAAGMDFLPAPRTWLELGVYREGVLARPARFGIFLEQHGETASVSFVLKHGAFPVGAISLAEPLKVLPGKGHPITGEMHIYREIYAALAIINAPRLIGRIQHMPHRGLEQRLAKAKGFVGKFPLHAWTEIKLSVADIGKRADGTEHEAHHTGEKCLHFCRAHLRIRNGKLERVSAHWRGNPALGMKRSKYAVVP